MSKDAVLARCAYKPFFAYVRLKRVRHVTFKLDGRRVRRVRKADRRGQYKALIDPRGLDPAVKHRVTARVVFRKKARKRAKTLKLRFRHCDSCLSRRVITIRLPRLKNGEKARRATVRYAGRKARIIKRPSRWRARVNLKGLPKGRYKVRIRVTTNRGRTVRQVRSFQTCENAPA